MNLQVNKIYSLNTKIILEQLELSLKTKTKKLKINLIQRNKKNIFAHS